VDAVAAAATVLTIEIERRLPPIGRMDIELIVTARRMDRRRVPAPSTPSSTLSALTLLGRQ
jgi:hypothetical protein